MDASSTSTSTRRQELGNSIRAQKAMSFQSFFVIAALLFMVTGCHKHDDLGGCSARISFQTQVLPIIELNCATAACHTYGGLAPFPLHTHREIDSAAIHANLLLSIQHQTPNPMPRYDPYLPQAFKLSDSLIQIIECWINQGRPNN